MSPSPRSCRIPASMNLLCLLFGRWARFRSYSSARGGRASILALDWGKAFDCISVPSLLVALRRFGIGESMLQAIGDIYANRLFFVSDDGHASTMRPQFAGISQGCPLSPFLFGILVSVLMSCAGCADCQLKGGTEKEEFGGHPLCRRYPCQR